MTKSNSMFLSCTIYARGRYVAVTDIRGAFPHPTWNKMSTC